jgi:hypothetical protein
MRYFSAPAAASQSIRLNVMAALGQPNGRASEPWGVNGDFVSGGMVYLALGPHHTEGEFWTPMIAAALEAGVEEITRAEYMAARPQPEGDV